MPEAVHLVVWFGFWMFVSIIGWWWWASWKTEHSDGEAS